MKLGDVVLNTTSYPGKYKLYCWTPDCPDCHSENLVILDDWSNAGGYGVVDDHGEHEPRMQGGFTGYEVQCSDCGARYVESEYFYTDDERAARRMENGS